MRDVRKLVEIGDTTSLFLSETAKPSLAVALSLYFKRSKDNRAKVSKILSTAIKQANDGAGLKVLEIEKEVGAIEDKSKKKKEVNLRLAAAGVKSLAKMIEDSYSQSRAEIEAGLLDDENEEKDKPKKRKDEKDETDDAKKEGSDDDREDHKKEGQNDEGKKDKKHKKKKQKGKKDEDTSLSESASKEAEEDTLRRRRRRAFYGARRRRKEQRVTRQRRPKERHQETR